MEKEFKASRQAQTQLRTEIKETLNVAYNFCVPCWEISLEDAL